MTDRVSPTDRAVRALAKYLGGEGSNLAQAQAEAIIVALKWLRDDDPEAWVAANLGIEGAAVLGGQVVELERHGGFDPDRGDWLSYPHDWTEPAYRVKHTEREG